LRTDPFQETGTLRGTGPDGKRCEERAIPSATDRRPDLKPGETEFPLPDHASKRTFWNCA
jgi:hypothetical protein